MNEEGTPPRRYVTKTEYARLLVKTASFLPVGVAA